MPDFRDGCGKCHGIGPWAPRAEIVSVINGLCHQTSIGKSRGSLHTVFKEVADHIMLRMGCEAECPGLCPKPRDGMILLSALTPHTPVLGSQKKTKATWSVKVCALDWAGLAWAGSSC